MRDAILVAIWVRADPVGFSRLILKSPNKVSCFFLGFFVDNKNFVQSYLTKCGQFLFVAIVAGEQGEHFILHYKLGHVRIMTAERPKSENLGEFLN